MPPPKKAKIVRANSAPVTYGGLDYPSAEELNIPPTSIDGYIRCIFGRKGIGKSTLVSQFPKSLTLMFEPRRRNLKIRQVNIQKVTAQQIMDGAPDVFSQVTHTVDKWIEDETINNLNFDSVDIFYECCYHHVCAQNKAASPADAGKSGPDIWIQIRDTWAVFFDTLAGTRLGINLVSHMKSRESEEIDGGKYQVRSPSCSPACLLYIKQAADLIFFYGILDGKRAMQIRDDVGSAEVAVGPQSTFLQPDGKEIFYLNMPSLIDKETGYDRLSKAFNNECWDLYTPEENRSVPKPKGPPKR